MPRVRRLNLRFLTLSRLLCHAGQRAARIEARCKSAILWPTGKNCDWAQDMSANKVQEIARVIGTLTQEELEELRLWLDEYAGPVALDCHIEADLTAGRLDTAVQSALDDEKHGRVRPL